MFMITVAKTHILEKFSVHFQGMRQQQDGIGCGAVTQTPEVRCSMSLSKQFVIHSTRCPHLLILPEYLIGLMFCPLYIYFFCKVGHIERKIFHLLIHSPSDHNGCYCTDLKPRVRRFFQVLRTGQNSKALGCPRQLSQATSWAIFDIVTVAVHYPFRFKVSFPAVVITKCQITSCKTLGNIIVNHMGDEEEVQWEKQA